MPPGAVGKRKRGDRTYSGDDGGRPSPYRPGNSNLAQHTYGGHHHGGGTEYRGRGGRRVSRGGGRGGGPRSPDNANGPFHYGRGNHSHHAAHQSSRPPSRPDSQQAQQPQAVTAPPQEQQAPAQQQIAEPSAPQTMDPNEVFPDLEEPPAPYSYDYITDESVQTWEDGGRQTLLSTATEIRQSGDDIAMSTLYQELLRTALDGRVQPSEIGSLVKDVLAIEVEDDGMETEMAPASASAFLDSVSMLGEADKKSRRLAMVLLRSEISPDVMREELDSDLLVHLNLVRPVFNKAFIRHQTNVLYRQSNYNLLREETEGYSKLLTELFTTSEDEMPSAEVVNSTFERVRSMIGTFDLDVGRTLDVTLDVFAAVIVKHHRFFVKFLRASSWWPEETLNAKNPPTLPYWAVPESNGLEALSDEEKVELERRRQERDVQFWEQAQRLNAEGKGILAFYRLRGLSLDFGDPATEPSDEEDKRWLQITGTDPPVGNKVAAQILGFKLRYYSSKARDAQDELPIGLVHLTALLIKIGFISLRDIYPHLWPEDANMEEIRQQKAKEKDEKERASRPGAGTNALAMAGALSDDTAPALRSTKEAEKPATKPEAAEKGAEQPSNVLPDPKDSKIELLKALLCIGAIPDALYMIGRFPWMLELVLDLPEYIHRLLHHSIHKLYDPIRPLQDMPELHKPGKVVDPDQSGVPKGELRRVDKIEKRSLRWLRLEQYKEEEGVFYRYYWDDWNDNVPVCQSIDDLFTLCDTFLNLSGVKVGQDPLLLSKLIRIGAKSLKDDPSDHNKKRWVDLCKKLLVPALSLTRHNPGIMNEMYHNILKHLPMATRYSIYSEWYLGPTSRLPAVQAAFELCKAETKDLLKRVSRNNVKQSARPLAKVSTSAPGVTFQVAITQMENYPNLVECFVECARYLTDLGYDVLAWATLNALGRRGREKTSADGLFTSKWLQSLSSFCGRVYWRYKMLDPDPILLYLEDQLSRGNPNDLKVLEEMIHSMGGISELTYNDGQILAMAGGPLLQSQTLLTMLDKRNESRYTAERLRFALVRTRVVSSFLIAFAHECQTRLHRIAESGAPLKLQGNVHDEMYRLFTQYFEFLQAWLPSEQFDRFVPAFTQLVNDYGVEPRIAFIISRASISLEIEESDRAKTEPAREISTAGNEPGEESEAMDTTEAVADGNSGSEPVPWNPVLRSIIEQTRETIGSQTLSLVGELFYMTFWQLSLNDMLVPTPSYDEEITRQKEKVREIGQDRTDLTIWGTRKREEKRNALNKFQEQLRNELKDQIARYSGFTRNRMSKEKEFWFAHTWGKHEALNDALLEHCFIPRMTLSPLDAYYCFRMFKLLHSTGAKNFRTMGFLDQFFKQKRLTVLFYMSTTKEAENMARFINEVLKDLSKWHLSKSVYEKEAYGPKKDLPGFCLRIGSDKSQFEFLGYDKFRRLLFKWHGQLANALRHCLEANEYMHIRNAITVLRGVVSTFPVVDMQAKKLLEAVTLLSKSDPRDDIKLAAMSLINMLSRRDRNNEFVPLASFYQMTKNGVPIPESKAGEAGKKLNAEATEFKPLPNGLVVRSDKPEPEDGEINSPVVADAPKQNANGVKSGSISSALTTAVESSENASGDRATGSKTESSSKAGTPRPELLPEDRASPVPGSRDHGRLANGGSSSSRATHALPARPEGSGLPSRRSERDMPSHRSDDRGGRELRSGRDIREPPYNETARGGRSVENTRGRGPERSGMDRSFDRGADRLPPAERERAEPTRRGNIHGGRHAPSEERTGRMAPRDDRPVRETRSRSGLDPNKDPLSRDRNAPDGGMPPPAPAMNPERARLLQGSSHATSREDPEAHGRHSHHTHSRPGSDRGSRGGSPARSDERDSRPPSRTERTLPADSHHGRPHADDRRMGSLRTDREPFVGHDDRTRGPPRSGAPPQSEPYGRNRDYGPPPGESQYGRLNGPDPTPTGPRSATGGQTSVRQSRAPSGPASHGSATERQASDRQAPSGPSSNRPPRLSGTFNRPPPASSAPSTPGADASGPGIHPDRVARIGGSGQPPSGPGSPADAPRGPSNNAPNNHGRPGPPPNQSGPPSPMNERGARDKRFAAINTTLQQSGGPPGRGEQGASIRGRGGRNQAQSPVGPGHMPLAGPGRLDGPPQRHDGQRSRGDLFGEDNPGPQQRGPHRNFNDQRSTRRSGRSPSPSGGRPPPRQGGQSTEDVRPHPRRGESREMRPRTDAQQAPPNALERETRRGRGPEDYGSGKEFQGRHGGDRRDVRDIAWGADRGGAGGGERPEGRGPPPSMPPEGPGRKRRGDYDEHGDPKRSRRGRGP